MAFMNFESTQIECIHMDNQIWVRGVQIGEALEYKNPRDKINKLYQAHKDEYTASMTKLIGISDLHPQNGGAGQKREVRVFSLRGAHLLAMFARTEKAKAFRRWLLDILENLHLTAQQIRQRYQEAASTLEQAKQQASHCGSGLNHWRKQKQQLRLNAEYWSAQCQLNLMLH